MHIIDTTRENLTKIELTQNDNHSGVISIKLTRKGEKINLEGKTARLALIKKDSKKGDIISNIVIREAKEGIINIPITSVLTRRKGIYFAMLSINDRNDWVEHTGRFTISFKEDLFDISSNAILSDSTFDILRKVLDDARNELNHFRVERDNIITFIKEENRKDLEEKKKEWDSLKKIAIEENSAVSLQNQINELNSAIKEEKKKEIKGKDLFVRDTIKSRTEYLHLLGNTVLNLADGTKEYGLTYKNRLVEIDVLSNIDTNQDLLIKADIKNNTQSEEKPKEIKGLIYFIDNLREKKEAYITLNGGVKAGQVSTVITKEDFKGVKFANCKKIISIAFYTQENYKGVDYTLSNVTVLSGEDISANIKDVKGFTSVGENEENKISIISKNVNIFNGELVVGSIHDDDGTYDKYIKNHACSSDFIDVIGDEFFRLEFTPVDVSKWFVIYFYTADEKLIRYHNTSKTFKTPKNCKKIKFKIENPRNVNIQDLRITFGKEYKEYAPYLFHKNDITLYQPLRGVGKYQDRVYFTNGELVQEINTRVDKINSELKWSKVKEQSENVLFTVHDFCGININKAYKTINDKGFGNFNGYNSDREGIYLDNYTGNLLFSINKSKLENTSLEAFKKYLKDIGEITLISNTLKPTIKKLKGITMDIGLFDDITFLTTSSRVQPDFLFAFSKNSNALIERNAKAIEELFRIINNLIAPSLVKNEFEIKLLNMKRGK